MAQSPYMTPYEEYQQGFKNINIGGQDVRVNMGTDGWDLDNALNQAGFLELKDPGLDHFRETGQGNFANPSDYWKWVYGGGNVVSGPNGQQYFQTPNGIGNTVNQPLNYDPFTFGDIAWMIPAAIATGGLAAGAFAGAGGAGAAGAGAAGAEGAFGGFAAGAGAEFPGLIGAGEGILGGATAGAGAGGVAGAAAGGAAGNGFSITDPSTWGNFNPITDTPPGTGQLLNGNADAGAGDGFDIGGGGGGMDGTAGAGASGGNGFDWTKFLGNSGWGNIIGSGIGALGSWLASNAQVKSAEEANALMWAMYQQNRSDLAPWRNAGGAAVNNLGGLLGLPGYAPVDYTKTPGYDFRYQQGMEELNNRLRAGGKFYSGQALEGGQEYAQNFATNEFTNTINRNLALAGLGQTSAANTVSAGNSAANTIGNNTIGAGNARASGYVGMGNNIAGGFGNYYNNQNQMAMLQLLMGQQPYA